MLDEVRAGAPLKAAEQNALIGEVNGLLRRGPPGDEWPSLLLIELTADPAMPDLDTADPGYFNVEPVPTATAKRCLCWLHGASDAYRSYAADAGDREIAVYFPTAARNADGYAFQMPAVSGQRLIAFANPQSGRWEALAPADAWAAFELKDALTPGGNATAYLRVAGATTAVEFEVYDVLGRFRGRAKSAYASPHDSGSFGEARFNPATGHWEIQSLTPHALMIRGVTSGAVAGESTFTLAAGVAVYQPTGAIIVTQDPAAAVTVQNGDMVWTLDSGAPVIAVWNENADNWQSIQAKCPVPA